MSARVPPPHSPVLIAKSFVELHYGIDQPQQALTFSQNELCVLGLARVSDIRYQLANVFLPLRRDLLELGGHLREVFATVLQFIQIILELGTRWTGVMRNQN